QGDAAGERPRARTGGPGDRVAEGPAMVQVFHPSMNTFARVTIFGAAFFAVGLVGVVYAVFRSPYVTGQNVPVDQPVQFSHEHHVNSLGIDCRYCHTSVETSWFAGIPPTETCM